MPKQTTASNSEALRAAGFAGLNAFIDRVIERRYYRRDTSSTSTGNHYIQSHYYTRSAHYILVMSYQ
jgi:hypothetical protein